MEINELNNKFATAGRIAFRQSAQGTAEAVLVNGYGSCEISLYGGRILNYRPMGHTPALFTDSESTHPEEKPICGGIPLYWPWVGSSPAEKLPRHGFARLMRWDVLSASCDSITSEITLGLSKTEESLKMWPYSFELIQKISLTDNLSVEVTTVNKGSTPFEISQSIHPFFKLRDITQTKVIGLENIGYTNLLTGNKSVQNGPFSIDKETYLIYSAKNQSCALRESGTGRSILIATDGADKMIVWNPWDNKTETPEGFQNDAYRKMIVVAPAHTADAPVTLKPAESITIKTAIQIMLS
ncbi:MAG: hypothetical protein R6V06_07465 [Kiritimatiellia bacterium]